MSSIANPQVWNPTTLALVYPSVQSLFARRLHVAWLHGCMGGMAAWVSSDSVSVQAGTRAGNRDACERCAQALESARASLGNSLRASRRIPTVTAGEACS